MAVTVKKIVLWRKEVRKPDLEHLLAPLRRLPARAQTSML